MWYRETDGRPVCCLQRDQIYLVINIFYHGDSWTDSLLCHYPYLVNINKTKIGFNLIISKIT